MTPTARSALAELRALGNPEDARFLQRYFKTLPGQYGAGDKFLGIRVPATRKIAAQYCAMPLPEVVKLLHAKEHEARLLGVIIMTLQYKRGDETARQEIFDAYLANTAGINNWDIVDVSAPSIVGAHLFGGSTLLLTKLAGSRSLWARRIAVMATMYFIKHGDFEPTLDLAKKLLHDEHDLIHKAVGWALREVGHRDRGVLEDFLKEHRLEMPRTMLRYAIEKFPGELRRKYMAR